MSTHTDEFMKQSSLLKEAVLEDVEPEERPLVGAGLDIFFGVLLNMERIALALEGIEINTRKNQP